MIEVVLTTLSTLIAAVGAAIILHYWETVRYPVRIVRVKSPTDMPVEGIKDLYEELFPEEDGTNYTREEISEIMNPFFIDPRHVKSENIVLAALWKSNLVGFIFCHFYPVPKKAIVSYYGLTPDRSQLKARTEAPIKLLKKLKKILTKKKCDYLFFDLQGTDNSISKEEARKRKSRCQAFNSRAKEFGLQSGMFQIEYQSPKVSLSEGIHEYPFSLHCIPLHGEKLSSVNKIQMLEFLEFVYLYCYGDFYHVDEPEFKAHQDHLHAFVDHYRKTLPDNIPVISRI